MLVFAAGLVLVLAGCSEPDEEPVLADPVVPASTPEPTPIPTPTTEPTATATPTAEELLLNTPGPMPRAMLFAKWWWQDRHRSDHVEVNVTLHNDIEMRGDSGLFLMACGALYVGDMASYFGLQTDVSDPARGNLGKGATFSRWYEGNEVAEVRLADTRVPERGWTESGDYEGNFVSVRGLYDWTEGRYSLQVRGGEVEEVGRWFEYWVVDESGDETWVGSLRFPLKDGEARVDRSCFSTIEVYGRPVRPSEIPYWRVTVDAPIRDGVRAELARTCYPGDVENFRNALVRHDGGSAQFEVGLDRIAHELEDEC